MNKQLLWLVAVPFPFGSIPPTRSIGQTSADAYLRGRPLAAAFPLKFLCAIRRDVLKTVRVAGREVMLRSIDGKRWFSTPSDLLEYARRRQRERVELGQMLRSRLRRDDRSGEVKSVLDADDLGGTIRLR
jgi:hypothetical protein